MKKLTVIFSIFIVFSCYQRDYIKKPSLFLNKQQMEDIIFDITFLEHVYSDGVLSRDSVLKHIKIDDITRHVLDKYDVSDSTFVENSKYYIYKTDEYEKILNNIVSRLENMKTIEDTLKLHSL